MAKKLSNYLGKIGIIVMISGMFVLFYDAYRVNQMFPVNYQFYDHPEIYVPIMGMLIAFVGTTIFIINFKQGQKIL